MQLYKLVNASFISFIFVTSVSNSAYAQDKTLLKQLEQSQDLRYTLSATFYLRRFPVAYQFRGFHAILTGKAKAAFLLAELLNDAVLKNIATRQLEYIVGYNPFAMSTIYGDGYDYPPLYGAYARDVVGAVPVGIETFENDDEPYMPMQVNATYKEIWTHTTAGVIGLLSMLFKD